MPTPREMRLIRVPLPVRDRCVSAGRRPRRSWFALMAGAVAALTLVGALVASLLAGMPIAASADQPQDATPTLAPGTGAIAGLAWEDQNGDGFYDAVEPPLAGMLVSAQNEDLSLTDTSELTGDYRLSGLQPGIYHVSAAAPLGYELTSASSYDVFVTAGAVLTLNFGARYVPTPTPSPTEPPVLDASDATHAYCGGVYQGDTRTGKANVGRYACHPAWDESGPELVYRIELDASQPVTVSLLAASADLDLFLLRYVFPESCLVAGDTYLTYAAEPGVYLLAVDGYQGAAGTFSLRVDCPRGVQATVTPTFTPAPTFTPTITPTPGPTLTPSPTRPLQYRYLPLILRLFPSLQPSPATLTLQQESRGYVGTTDTTLDAWYPDKAHGTDDNLRLFYSQPPKVTTQKAPLLRFDLTLLPTDAQISRAELRLYLIASAAYDLRGRVHGLLRAWDEQSATWQQPAPGQAWSTSGAQGAGFDYLVSASDTQRIQEGNRWYSFDVTALAGLWVRDPARNLGMIMLAQAGDSSANVEARFASREHKNPELRPQLVVTYVAPVRADGS